MSVTVKIKFNLGGMKSKINNRSVHDAATVRTIANKVIAGIKDSVSKGLSPVKGRGRFEGYAIQRNGKGYPETADIKSEYPDKKTRPVNLNLSGEMLRALKKGDTKEAGVLVGIYGSDKINMIADVHNEGRRKDMPQRKFLPTSPGEEFILSLTRLIKDIYLNRISAIIKVLNR